MAAAGSAVDPALAAAAEGAPVLARGDFVRVDGRWLGRVVRVTGRGRDALLEVESSDDLVVRRYPLRRHRIEKVAGG